MYKYKTTIYSISFNSINCYIQYKVKESVKGKYYLGMSSASEFLIIPFLALQGILFASPECLKGPSDLIRLWLHESSRVYGDKLIDTKDCDLFQKKLLETAYKYFEVSL